MHNYLRDAKVRTSAGYMTMANSTWAIPCENKRASSAPRISARSSSVPSASTDSAFAAPQGRRAHTAPYAARHRSASRTEYADQFREQSYCYASMDRKPLVPYNPLAARSRLAVEDPWIPIKNASNMKLGNAPLHHDKKCFVTTYQSFFKGEPCDPRSNQAIVGASTKFARHLREQ